MMHQLQRQASQPHFRVRSLPEKTSVARLRLEKVYNLRPEYASYASMTMIFAFSGHTLLIAVDSEEEADKVIEELKSGYGLN